MLLDLHCTGYAEDKGVGGSADATPGGDLLLLIMLDRGGVGAKLLQAGLSQTTTTQHSAVP